ncbi:hypothetical protein [Flavobacterium panacagri]|uniref:hypothetical protein n=1 Tax=Flavobacterium panacagri TaxID=3034146 RepID=UPI0025A53D33|nr:hypothetical protein [Flavobacterium panacagri]
MYTNVEPENKNGKRYPKQLVGFYKSDSIEEKKSVKYIGRKLDYRIITYMFRNDSLFFKNIVTYPNNIRSKEIADLSSQKKIVKYYTGLKIPIEIILEGKRSSRNYPTLFMIDGFKTSIYYSEDDKSYDLFINYINDNFYRNIVEKCYSGHMSNASYY